MQWSLEQGDGLDAQHSCDDSFVKSAGGGNNFQKPSHKFRILLQGAYIVIYMHMVYRV